MDFLLPYDNHDRLPVSKTAFDDVIYGDWLIRAFDHWYGENLGVPIRMFDSIMRLLLGGHSLVESLGVGQIDFIVVETNGDIEAVDSLKAALNGSTVLGFDVFNNTFDEVTGHVKVQARQSGADGLCGYCKRCAIVNVCGGGYLPTRYSRENGFNNPSVYCRDLSKLIYHIHSQIGLSLPKAVA
jgi:uncharacterized protein